MPKSQVPLSTFNTFGDLLKYLRRRARLTQRDLSIAVGYSEAQISRLETNQRSPEMAALKALFVPALGIDDEPEVIARLTELAANGLTMTGVAPEPEMVSKMAGLSILETAKATGPVVSSLPTGTVTFLFTDIVGSTSLWEKIPNEMQASLAQHHTILRQAIEANGGQVFQIIGDAFQAAFRLAPQALAAAVSAQRSLQAAKWEDTGPIQVRMGLHTGPAELDPAGNAPYAVSHTLNRAARVMSAGYGGQILLSQEAADLVARMLPGGVTIMDLGEHHLKGMQLPEHLYQLVVPDLIQAFPPLATGIMRRDNLPLQLTSFIGREKAIEEVIDLLHKHRLVTIHGSGGTGKTRLCEEVAAHVLESYPDGVWLVELAPLADAEKIPELITATLKLYDSRSRPALDLLIDYLSDKRMLLLLDNCEHLIDACARLADRLLHECPQLSILATSREALGVSGETTYRVPSLSIPEPQQALEEIHRIEAVRLFAERAASIQPGFLVTEANAPAVVQICRRLDGIPLALELAAARMDLLSPEQIASRLDKRFRLLTGGSRTALPRQQTLRASIDWSYSLLTESERLLLQRLSVFAGGWTLEAAEGVCGFDGLNDFEVLDGLGQLVKKSLVVTDSQAGATVRYRLLETIRQYAREKLLDAGTGADVRTRHLNYYLELAEQAEPQLRGPDQVDWCDRLEAEIDNLRAALEWSREDEIEKGLRIAGSLMWFWRIRMQSNCSEIADWLEHSLAACQVDEESPKEQVQVWVKALAVQAVLLTALGKTGKKVVGLFEKSLSLYEKLGSAGRGDLVCLYYTWAINKSVNGGDQAEFRAMMRKALSIAEELGDRFGMAECLPWVDWTDDLTDKIHLAQRGLALRREIGDLEGIWWDLLNLARIYYAKTEYPQALLLTREGMKICQRVKTTWGSSLLSYYQGLILTEMGRFAEAISWLERSVQQNLVFGNRFWVVVFRIGLASVFQKLGNEEASQYHYQDAFETARKGEYENEQAIIRFCQGEIAWARGEYTSAEQYYNETLTVGQKINSGSSMLGMYGLGKIALALGDRSAAWDQFRQAIQTWMRFETKDYLSQVLEAMAVTAASPVSSEPTTNTAAIYAARLHGAGQALNYFARLVFLTRAHFESYDMEACLAPARAVLGEVAYARAYAEGQAMKLEQAVEFALEYKDQ